MKILFFKIIFFVFCYFPLCYFCINMHKVNQLFRKTLLAVLNISATFLIFFYPGVLFKDYSLIVLTCGIFYAFLWLYQNAKIQKLHYVCLLLPVFWMALLKITDWLPIIGISFLAFRISYLVYEFDQETAELPHPLDFFSFSFFTPTFLLGPISPYAFFEQSIKEKGKFTKENIFNSINRITIGSAKYFILSSIFAHFSVLGFDDNMNYALGVHLVTVFASYLYLYLNFSGMNDIAIGTSGLLGMQIKENFNNPLTARNLSDYWNRWHMTLSGYIKDVFFQPFAMFLMRHLSMRIHPTHLLAVAIMASFILIGLWHGLGLKYFFLGVFHGLGVLAFHYFSAFMKNRSEKTQELFENNPVIRITSISLTFTYIAFVSLIFLKDF